MPRVHPNGLEFEYEEFGDRRQPPLLLVMGLGAQMILWREDFCAQLAARGYLSPAVPMWTPNVMIGLLGLIGLRAASRTAGTTRGGDLADLTEVLFGWLRSRSRSGA